MKIRPVGAELLHADRQSDRNNEGSRCFSQFYESVSNLGATRIEMALQILRTSCFCTVTILCLPIFV
jgi:hypothetical protein